MAYQVDQTSGDIVIGGFQNGIGDSPYSGLTNVQNVNITSIPGEASVSFGVSSKMQAPSYSGILATATGDGFAITLTGLTTNSFLETGQAVSFSDGGITGLGTGTIAYIASATKQSGTSETINFTLSYGSTSSGTYAIGTSGTSALTTINLVLGQRGTINKNYTEIDKQGNHYVADSNGRVWSDKFTTQGGTNFSATNSWTYMGNTTDSSSYGNGLVYLETTNSGGGLDGWLFLWRQGQIDYVKLMAGGSAIPAGSLSWQYGWKTSLTLSTLLGTTTAYSHEAVITPGQQVAFCDGYNMRLFFQNAVGTTFDPSNAATYTYSSFPILAVGDISQCCSFLGSSLLIGGIKNVIYPWDLTSNQPTPPLIQLPEVNIKNIITVKSNAYVFCGNRGKIYITNGSQADFWKKVPDHLSGTVQPTFQWGATGYRNNQLYFGVFQTSAGVPSSTNIYGSMWAMDLGTQAVYVSNTFSNNLTGGYCAALLPQSLGEYAGNGWFIGWANYVSGAYSNSGIDSTIATPYTDGQAYIISDLIPVGTLLEPTTPAQFEYKLTSPLLPNESVEIQVAPYFGGTFTSLGTTNGGTSSVILSDIFSNKIQNQQWLLVKAILTSTTSSPSLVRLNQIRIKGATVKDQVSTAPFGIR